MTKIVKKRLQAVVALLVTLMIMIGIMPSEPFNMTVHADTTSYTVYFDGNYQRGAYAAWGTSGSVGIHIWKDSGTGSFDSIYAYTTAPATGSSLYSYTFNVPDNVNLKLQFIKGSNSTTDHTCTTGESVTNNGVYGLNENNAGASSPHLTCYSVQSSSSSVSGGGQSAQSGREDGMGTYRVANTKLWDYLYDTSSNSYSSSGVTYYYDADRVRHQSESGDKSELISSDTASTVKGGNRWNNTRSVPYEKLNTYIYNYFNGTVGSQDAFSNGSKALYFGNFYGTWSGGQDYQQYATWACRNNNDNNKSKRYSDDVIWGGTYWDITVNNSEAAGGTYTRKTGLVDSTLVDNNIAKGGKVLPYFLDTMGGNAVMYNSFDSSTGFVLQTNTVKGVTTYYYTSATRTINGTTYNRSGNNYFNGTQFNLINEAPSNYTSSGGGSTTAEKGLFPFNNTNIGGSGETGREDVNYGFGIRLDIDFYMTEDGRIKDTDGNKHDIVFDFCGDDDVWVFIDGVLMLDIGGDHGAISDSINFANKNTIKGYLTGAGKTQEQADAFYDTTVPHKMSFFYMERGMFESNMTISFTLVPADDQPKTALEVEKEVQTSDVTVLDGTYPTGITAVTDATDLASIKSIFNTNVDLLTFKTNVGEGTSIGTKALGYLTSPTYKSTNKIYEGTPTTTNPTGSFELKPNVTGPPAEDNRVVFREDIRQYSNSDVLQYNKTIMVQEVVADNIGYAYGNSGNIKINSLFATDLEKYFNNTLVGSRMSNTSGVSFQIQSDESKNKTDKVKFINRMQTGSLAISKSIKNDTNGEITDATETTDKTFTFRVTLDNFGGLNLEDSYTAGTPPTRNDFNVVFDISVTVTAGQSTATSAVLTGIPSNTHYTIVETTNHGYTASGTLSGTLGVSEAKVVEVTNTKTVTVENNVDIGIIKRWYPLNSSTTLPTEIKFLLQKSTNGTTWEDVTTAGANGVVTLTNTNAKKYDASGNVVNGDGAYEYMEWKLAARITVPKDTDVQYRILEYSEGQKSLILENEGLYATDCKVYYKDGNNDTNVKALSAATYANNTELVAWLVENNKIVSGADESAITAAVQALTSAEKTTLTNANITANPVVDLSVKNEYIPMGTAMPKTGARGVYAIVTFGAFAITIAGVALLIYRKKLQTVNIYAVKGSEKPKE